jgi:hypothetical protein
MAKWVPDADKIGPKETLGRRLYDQPSLVGAVDQKAALRSMDFRNFEDQRDGQVSLDRLGKSSPERDAVNYLTPRAEAAGATRKPPKKFDGWAAIQAQKLQENKNLRLALAASPISGLDFEQNIFHCHAYSIEGCDPYFVALHLQTLFEKHGAIHPSPNNPLTPGWIKTILLQLINPLLRLIEKIR